jgi:hypothetical protein
MTLKTSFDFEPGFIRATVTGKYDPGVAVSAFELLLTAFKLHDCYSAVINVINDAAAEHAIEKVHYSMNIQSRLVELPKELRDRIKLAYVLNEKNELIWNPGLELAVDAGINIKVFHDEDEAVAWILANT